VRSKQFSNRVIGFVGIIPFKAIRVTRIEFPMPKELTRFLSGLPQFRSANAYKKIPCTATVNLPGIQAFFHLLFRLNARPEVAIATGERLRLMNTIWRSHELKLPECVNFI